MCQQLMVVISAWHFRVGLKSPKKESYKMEAMGVFGGLISLILIVLAVFLPFFIYGTNMRTRQTALALKQTNAMLEEMLEIMKKDKAVTTPDIDK